MCLIYFLIIYNIYLSWNYLRLYLKFKINVIIGNFLSLITSLVWSPLYCDHLSIVITIQFLYYDHFDQFILYRNQIFGQSINCGAKRGFILILVFITNKGIFWWLQLKFGYNQISRLLFFIDYNIDNWFFFF